MLSDEQIESLATPLPPDVVLAMLDELDALRIDAERYRCLRRGQYWSVIDGIGDTLRADALDAAIDAARGTK